MLCRCRWGAAGRDAEAEVAAAFDPLVALFSEDRAGQSDQRRGTGRRGRRKMPTQGYSCYFHPGSYCRAQTARGPGFYYSAKTVAET